MSTKTPEQRSEERTNILLSEIYTALPKPVNDATSEIVHRRTKDWSDGYAACIREQVEPLEAENAKLRDALEAAILELDKCERACKRAYTIADHHSILDLRVVPNQLKVRNIREVLASLTT